MRRSLITAMETQGDPAIDTPDIPPEGSPLNTINSAKVADALRALRRARLEINELHEDESRAAGTDVNDADV